MNKQASDNNSSAGNSGDDSKMRINPIEEPTYIQDEDSDG